MLRIRRLRFQRIPRDIPNRHGMEGNVFDWLTKIVNRRRRGPSDPPAVDAARQLSREGRYRDAIDLLSAAFDASGEAELAKELVLVRYDAAMQSPGIQRTGDWPPEVPDLFPDRSTIPEVASSGFTPESLASAIVHNGGLIVRGLLSKGEVERCTACVHQAFEARQRHQAGVASREDTKWYSPFQTRSDGGVLNESRRFAEMGAGVLGVDSPATVHEVLKMAESRGVIAAVEEFLDERPAVSVMKTTLRIVPPTTGTSWHQDGAFLGSYVRSVNMWIALSECGEEAPSLDVIPKRFDHIVSTGTEGAPFSWSVADSVAERVAREAGVAILHPNFAPGDAIFFDHMNLHRTGVRPGMTKDRLAIEWWFFAPSHFPERQIPILA